MRLSLGALICFAAFSVTEVTAETVTGLWNGFLGQTNIVECSNSSEREISLALTLRHSSGETIAERVFDVPARGTVHTVLNGLNNQNLGDQYGTVVVDGITPETFCHTAVYSLTAAGASKPVKYAFSLPFGQTETGAISGIFNSMNPEGSASPVLNWLTVFNASTSSLGVTVELYDSIGTFLRAVRLDQIAAQERRDIPLGHPDGQTIGLYRVVPDTSYQRFGAFVTRYGMRADYLFAFPLQALKGSCDPGALPASTMDPALNWGEAANAGDQPLPILVEVRNRNGELLFVEERILPPHAQHHYPLHQYIGARSVGTFRVRCADGVATGSLLAQSLFYGQRSEDSPELEWAYASQGEGFLVDRRGSLIVNAANTFLGAANWIKLQNNGDQSLTLRLDTFDAAGSAHGSESRTILNGGNLDFGLHGLIGSDAIGLNITDTVSTSPAVTGELLRVFPRVGGGIGSIMRVKSHVVSAPVQTANNECFDGIDNNSDGLVDFADFGCFGPNAQETDTDYGFAIHRPSSDSRIVYVSTSEGNDSNDGLSPDRPKRSIIPGAYALIRNGYPDWLLLKRGDTFDHEDWHNRFGQSPTADPNHEGNWDKSGRSAAEPIVIGSYGQSTQRPLIKTGNRFGFRAWSKQAISLVGMDFYANFCDPSSPDFQGVSCNNGIVFQYANQDILIEDNRVRFYGGGINIQSIDAGIFDRVKVQRNVISHSYSGVGHSQGMYSFGPGELLIKENIFYHNGWNEEYRMNIKPAAFNASTWRAVSDGKIDVQLNGIWYQLVNLNFSQVSSLGDVAAVFETALRAAAGVSAAIVVEARGLYLIVRAALPSREEYSMRRSTSSLGGTDIHGASFLDIRDGNPRTPAATIYNRNMYLAYGYSNTVVEGNVTAVGASGGIQLRMGGPIRNNLTLDEPVAISVGHAENPAGVPWSTEITDNVILGSSNIGAAPRGFGLGFGGDSFVVERNIIAHNRRGTANVEGLFAGTDGSGAGIVIQNGIIRDNIVYRWGHPQSGGAAFAARHRLFSNVEIFDNYFLQPGKGTMIGVTNPESIDPGHLVWGGNTYWQAETAPSPVAIAQSRYSLSQWQSLVGETASVALPNFRDPERTIDTYMESIGEGSSLEEFMEEACGQSRFRWRREYMAQAVNDYIREGFEVQ